MSLKAIDLMCLLLKHTRAVYSPTDHVKMCVPQHPIGEISKVVYGEAITVI